MTIIPIAPYTMGSPADPKVGTQFEVRYINYSAPLSEAVTTYRTVPVMEDDVQSAEDIAAGKPVTQHPKLDADGKAVTQRVDSNYSVSDRTVIAALVNAVKELKAEIDALKAAK